MTWTMHIDAEDYHAFATQESDDILYKALEDWEAKAVSKGKAPKARTSKLRPSGGGGSDAAGQIQDAGLEKGAATMAAPVIVNSSPSSTISNSSAPTTVALAGRRDLSSDPSLNVNP